MKKLQIVIDTNVLVAGLRSKHVSYRLLQLLEDSRFEINVSVPVVIEYEDALYRQLKHINLSKKDVDDVLDYLCQIANQHSIFFLWRPYLKDPKDDMILELAVTANCDYIVTFNKKDFANIKDFNLKIISPFNFLQILDANYE